MHEFAIAEGIISMVEDAASGQNVVMVTVEVGGLSGISIEALRFALPYAAEGTAVEKAAFDLIEVAGQDLMLRSIEVEEVLENV